jgi:limonene-1,2-epoxide hydrolase
MSPEQVVREFCAAVSKRDPEMLRPLLAPSVIYQNVGMEASDGIDATIENLAGQWAMFPETYEFEIVNLAVSDDVVLTERIDRVGPGSGAPVAPVPLMGRFEVESGLITRWYDYFDSALVAKMFAGDDVHELVPS